MQKRGGKMYTCMCNWVTMLYSRKKNCIGEITILKMQNITFMTFIYILLLRAVPKAYGSAQAKGWIGATAAGHSHSGMSRVCELHHSSWPRWIPNPLSEARDPTRILMDTSWIHFCCTTIGTLQLVFFKNKTIREKKNIYIHIQVHINICAATYVKHTRG